MSLPMRDFGKRGTTMARILLVSYQSGEADNMIFEMCRPLFVLQPLGVLLRLCME